ncbi:unnamed protein product, partial [marine sediment metagenome]
VTYVRGRTMVTTVVRRVTTVQDKTVPICVGD